MPYPPPDAPQPMHGGPRPALTVDTAPRSTAFEASSWGGRESSDVGVALGGSNGEEDDVYTQTTSPIGRMRSASGRGSARGPFHRSSGSWGHVFVSDSPPPRPTRLPPATPSPRQASPSASPSPLVSPPLRIRRTSSSVARFAALRAKFHTPTAAETELAAPPHKHTNTSPSTALSLLAFNFISPTASPLPSLPSSPTLSSPATDFSGSRPTTSDGPGGISSPIARVLAQFMLDDDPTPTSSSSSAPSSSTSPVIGAGGNVPSRRRTDSRLIVGEALPGAPSHDGPSLYSSPRRPGESPVASSSAPRLRRSDMSKQSISSRDSLDFGSTSGHFSPSGSATSSGPTASVMFPTRPPMRSRDASSSSTTSNIFDSPSDRAFLSAHSAPTFSPYGAAARYDDSRRPSAASMLSATSSAASILYRGRALSENGEGGMSDTELTDEWATDQRTSEMDRFEKLHRAEKRKRLATFLDETAEAMEGGKSLHMVLPGDTEGEPEGGRSLARLAEGNGGRLHLAPSLPPFDPPARRKSSSSTSVFYSGPHSPSDSNDVPSASASPERRRDRDHVHLSPPRVGGFTSSSPAAVSSPRQNSFTSTEGSPKTPNAKRNTVYFTPTLRSGESESETTQGDEEDLSTSGNDLIEQEDEDDEEEEQKIASRRAGRVGRADFGLGFDVDLSYDGQSTPPATFGAVLDTEGEGDEAEEGDGEDEDDLEEEEEDDEPTALEVEALEADRLAKEKTADRRRRTTAELVETERRYSHDLAVVQDIYLARAQGADMAEIADHVMSTGLGLVSADDNPSSPVLSPVDSIASPSSNTQRRPSQMRRPSLAPSLVSPGAPLIVEKDIHIIFANLEEVASLAETLAEALDAAEITDRIGEVFVEMLPRIQQVYATYCARHHRAIVRLQELEPSLRTYLTECGTLSHGRTNAWDLASLLIKPVQRCLKYPLLLNQILAITPKDHPDRNDLKRATTDMLIVCEHINEFKKRHDLVGRIVDNKKSSSPRTPATLVRASGPSSSSSSFSKSVTKKFFRSSTKVKQSVGLAERAKHDQFDSLAQLLEDTRTNIVAFSTEMRNWSKGMKTALEAQRTMVGTWTAVYAPIEGETVMVGGSHERLCVFLEECLEPVIAGPWNDLDYEIRSALLVKIEHLLSLFSNPRRVISKRNDKHLDHSRYLAKKLLVDRRGSEEFGILTTQLLEELPRFLNSASRYFKIITTHYAVAQRTYFDAVTTRWTAFADQWLPPIAGGQSYSLETSFESQHLPIAELMEQLALGFNVPTLQVKTPRPRQTKSSERPSELATRRASRQRFTSSAASSDYIVNGKGAIPNRSSFASESSAPSLTLSSGGGSSTGGPATPPLGTRDDRRFSHHGPPSLDLKHPPLPVPPSRLLQRRATSPAIIPRLLPDLRTPTPAALNRLSGDQSVFRLYIAAEADIVQSLGKADPGPPTPNSPSYLYLAAATTSASSASSRGGYPILTFDMGELLQIEKEEPDDEEQGGAGWCLGVKENGQRGWARTEDLSIVSD